MDHHLADFIDDLQTTHGKNLVSVILYGSAAAGDHSHRDSDYNLLVALEKIGPEDLRKAHAAVREWAKLGHHVPVYFTASEIEHAADVFPIEFQQMQRARKVLFGRDVLLGIDVSHENLRHQVEFELRSNLIRLRRQYIPASVSVESLARLMSDSLASFIALFRGLLLLKGLDPPAKRHQTLAVAIEKLDLNGQPLEKIFNIRSKNLDRNMTETEANELFGEYLEQIERAIDAVDSMEG
jgi:hypothetical protein